MQGKVKFYSERKGYGFIIDDSDKKEYFFHATELKGFKFIKNDHLVSFDLKDTKRGINAANVIVIKN